VVPASEIAFAKAGLLLDSGSRPFAAGVSPTGGKDSFQTPGEYDFAFEKQQQKRSSRETGPPSCGM